MKILSMGVELLRADSWTDGQTDRHEAANSRLSQYCERT